MRIRTILITCVGLLALLVIAFVIFVATLDPNSYKGVIEAKAREATGRELVIKGPIHLSLSPRPTLVAEDLSFANMPGGARPEMVTAKRLEIALDVMPLITSRRISVARLRLQGADLLLEIGRDGKPNWQFAGAEPPPPPQGAAQPAAPAPRSAGGGTNPLTVRSIEVTDSTVTYRTDATGKEQTLSIGRVAIQPGASAIPIEAAGALDQVPFELKGSVGSGVLAGAPHFPVTLNGHLLGFDLSLDGEFGQTFKAKVSAGDLKPLATALGTALPDLGAVSIDTTVSGPLTAATLDPLQLGIGKNQITGNAAIKLGGPRPEIAANLVSKEITLASAPAIAAGPAAPAANGEAKPADKDAKLLFSPAPLPFDALRAVDLSARVEISSLKYNDLELDGVSATVTLANGLLTAKPIAAGIAGGHMTIDATLDAAHQTVSLDGIGQQIAIDVLLKQLGVTPYLAAKADLSTKLAGHGESLHAIAATLDGTAGLTIGSGTIQAKAVKSGLGEAAKLLGGGDAAQLECAVAQFQIAKGIATPRPLVIETGDAIVSGAGAIDLGREMIDLKIAPRMRSANLAQLAIPVHVSGPLTAPGVQADTAGIAESAAAAIASGGVKPLAGILPFGGAGGGAPAATGGCRAQPAPAAAGTAPKPAAPAPAPAKPGNLLNNLGRSLNLGR